MIHNRSEQSYTQPNNIAVLNSCRTGGVFLLTLCFICCQESPS